MTGKQLIDLIKENDAEDYEMEIITEDGAWLEVNSIGINPSAGVFGLSNN